MKRPLLSILATALVLVGCRKRAVVGALDPPPHDGAPMPTVDAPAPVDAVATEDPTPDPCGKRLPLLATLAPNLLPPHDRKWSLIERRKAVDGAHPQRDAIVLHPSVEERCETFFRSDEAIAGPFFGFPASSAGWKAAAFVAPADFGNLVVAVFDDKDAVRALYYHDHNVNMDGGFHLTRTPLDGAFAAPTVDSYSGSDGESDEFVEMYGAAASGEPRVLLSLHGTGMMPHAVAAIDGVVVGPKPELDGVTSTTKPRAVEDHCYEDCIVCKKTHWVFSPKSEAFERSTTTKAVPCP